VLAGGQGARMGGADKGLLPLHGRALIAHTLERFAPQVGQMLISANRGLEAYAGFGYPVLSDELPNVFDGPLAGLLAGLRACTTPLLAVVPCDSPQLPLDLVEKLATTLRAEDSQVVHAATAVRSHPIFMLCRRDALRGLEDYFAGGGRKIRDWQNQIGAVPVIFPDESPFVNLNTPEDLQGLR
jgi:molybdopterin-guanine dinucleotide biosynthesis protein A